AQEVAWSRNQAAYSELLKEYVNAAQDLSQRLGNAQMRYTSKLVPLIPADTVVFISMPNVGQSLSESYGLFKKRVAENSVLSEWWRESSSNRVVVDEMVNWMNKVAADLGPEIVLAVP